MAHDHDAEEKAASDTAESSGGQLPPPSILEIDPVYEALGHPRRRYLCYTLLEDTE